VGLSEAALSDLLNTEDGATVHLPETNQGRAGLGMTIIKRLAHLAGYRFNGASIFGKGTNFSIGPIRPCDRPVVVAQQDMASGPLAGVRIEIRLDDKPLKEALSQQLVGWGCQLLEGPASIEGTKIVIVDGDQSGDAIGHEMRNPRATMIILTSDANEHISSELGGAEVYVLRKPISPAELRSTLMACLAD
jgi:hypothetical protein